MAKSVKNDADQSTPSWSQWGHVSDLGTAGGNDCPHQWTKSSRFSPRTLAHQDQELSGCDCSLELDNSVLGSSPMPCKHRLLTSPGSPCSWLSILNLTGFLSVPRLHPAFFLPQGLCCCTFFARNVFDGASSLLFFVPWQNFKSLKWGFL